jgi:para-nitrobenzyl esterase
LRKLVTAALSLLALSAGVAHAAIDYADVTGGRLKGVLEKDVAVFKGIPFAAPPVGALRWKVPQPVIPWRAVREANAFARPCAQTWFEQPNPTREDCLYLNVWTAAASSQERRPVMVWIHGGGLTNGWSWQYLAQGDRLAKEGVVVVTIAYRLGPLGFLAHPELSRESGKGSGNYGLYDMVAALQWVQANITQFGGDPSRVMVFGGSAGGVAISLLAGAPKAKGLFSRAADQGGGGFFARFGNTPEHPFPLPTLEEGEAAGVALFKRLGASDLKAAREISADAIMRAAGRERLGVSAVVDGDLLQGLNVDLFERGEFNDMPVLAGYTSDEVGDIPAKEVDPLRAAIARSPCRESAASLLAAYPDPKTSNRYLVRDFALGWSQYTWARLQSTKGRNAAYVYFFDVHDDKRPHGAPHATENPYIFGTYPIEKKTTARDVEISALMRRYWVNFAATGNPNSPGLPEWKAFDERTQDAMVFSNESVTSQRIPGADGIKAWDGVLRCRQ